MHVAIAEAGPGVGSAGGEAEKEPGEQLPTRISVGAYGVCTHNMALVVNRLCPEQCALPRPVGLHIFKLVTHEAPPSREVQGDK